MKPVLAVAAHSARVMAECAAREGFDVIALDLFGDQDTRRACTQWWPLAEAGRLSIDANLTLKALSHLASRGEVLGWVPGSGFEGQTELLAQAGAILPLIGTAPDAVRRIRDAATFFGALNRLGIAHPPTSLNRPADAQGWLRKDLGGTGGWRVTRCAKTGLREADTLLRNLPTTTEGPLGALSTGVHYQRELPGQPMSVTFVATADGARILGFNHLLTRRFGVHPFVYRGVVGPVPVQGMLVDEVTGWLRLLCAEFDLRGLCGLDFMWQGSQASLLEINPRPPASMALYVDALPGGLMSAHVQACATGAGAASYAGEIEWPGLTPSAGPVRGTQVVYARRALTLGHAQLRRLQAWPQAHDLPAGVCRLAAGDPLCSVDTVGSDALAVARQLQRADTTLWTTLETWT